MDRRLGFNQVGTTEVRSQGMAADFGCSDGSILRKEFVAVALTQIFSAFYKGRVTLSSRLASLFLGGRPTDGVDLS